MSNILGSKQTLHPIDPNQLFGKPQIKGTSKTPNTQTTEESFTEGVKGLETLAGIQKVATQFKQKEQQQSQEQKAAQHTVTQYLEISTSASTKVLRVPVTHGTIPLRVTNGDVSETPLNTLANGLTSRSKYNLTNNSASQPITIGENDINGDTLSISADISIDLVNSKKASPYLNLTVGLSSQILADGQIEDSEKIGDVTVKINLQKYLDQPIKTLSKAELLKAVQKFLRNYSETLQILINKKVTELKETYQSELKELKSDFASESAARTEDQVMIYQTKKGNWVFNHPTEKDTKGRPIQIVASSENELKQKLDQNGYGEYAKAIGYDNGFGNNEQVIEVKTDKIAYRSFNTSNGKEFETQEEAVQYANSNKRLKDKTVTETFTLVLPDGKKQFSTEAEMRKEAAKYPELGPLLNDTNPIQFQDFIEVAINPETGKPEFRFYDPNPPKTETQEEQKPQSNGSLSDWATGLWSKATDTIGYLANSISQALSTSKPKYLSFESFQDLVKHVSKEYPELLKLMTQSGVFNSAWVEKVKIDARVTTGVTYNGTQFKSHYELYQHLSLPNVDSNGALRKDVLSAVKSSDTIKLNKEELKALEIFFKIGDKTNFKEYNPKEFGKLLESLEATPQDIFAGKQILDRLAQTNPEVIFNKGWLENNTKPCLISAETVYSIDGVKGLEGKSFTSPIALQLAVKAVDNETYLKLSSGPAFKWSDRIESTTAQVKIDGQKISITWPTENGTKTFSNVKSLQKYLENQKNEDAEFIAECLEKHITGLQKDQEQRQLSGPIDSSLEFVTWQDPIDGEILFAGRSEFENHLYQNWNNEADSILKQLKQNNILASRSTTVYTATTEDGTVIVLKDGDQHQDYIDRKFHTDELVEKYDSRKAYDQHVNELENAEISPRRKMLLGLGFGALLGGQEFIKLGQALGSGPNGTNRSDAMGVIENYSKAIQNGVNAFYETGVSVGNSAVNAYRFFSGQQVPIGDLVVAGSLGYVNPALAVTYGLMRYGISQVEGQNVTESLDRIETTSRSCFPSFPNDQTFIDLVPMGLNSMDGQYQNVTGQNNTFVTDLFWNDFDTVANVTNITQLLNENPTINGISARARVQSYLGALLTFHNNELPEICAPNPNVPNNFVQLPPFVWGQVWQCGWFNTGFNDSAPVFQLQSAQQNETTFNTLNNDVPPVPNNPSNTSTVQVPTLSLNQTVTPSSVSYTLENQFNLTQTYLPDQPYFVQQNRTETYNATQAPPNHQVISSCDGFNKDFSQNNQVDLTRSTSVTSYNLTAGTQTVERRISGFYPSGTFDTVNSTNVDLSGQAIPGFQNRLTGPPTQEGLATTHIYRLVNIQQSAPQSTVFNAQLEHLVQATLANGQVVEEVIETQSVNPTCTEQSGTFTWSVVPPQNTSAQASGIYNCEHSVNNQTATGSTTGISSILPITVTLTGENPNGENGTITVRREEFYPQRENVTNSGEQVGTPTQTQEQMTLQSQTLRGSVFQYEETSESIVGPNYTQVVNRTGIAGGNETLYNLPPGVTYQGQTTFQSMQLLQTFFDVNLNNVTHRVTEMNSTTNQNITTISYANLDFAQLTQNLNISAITQLLSDNNITNFIDQYVDAIDIDPESKTIELKTLSGRNFPIPPGGNNFPGWGIALIVVLSVLGIWATICGVKTCTDSGGFIVKGDCGRFWAYFAIFGWFCPPSG